MARSIQIVTASIMAIAAVVVLFLSLDPVYIRLVQAVISVSIALVFFFPGGKKNQKRHHLRLVK